MSNYCLCHCGLSHQNLSNKCNDDLFLKTEKEDELLSSDIHNDPRAIRSANIGNRGA